MHKAIEAVGKNLPGAKVTIKTKLKVRPMKGRSSQGRKGGR